MTEKETRYTISQLAGELGISTRTIRFYEEKGLISPKRTEGNQRTYSQRNKARLKLILRGKRFGFSLEEIAEMIGMADADITEADQIKKSLEYGEIKLSELNDRKKELIQLEQDLLDTRDILLARLKELEG